MIFCVNAGHFGVHTGVNVLGVEIKHRASHNAGGRAQKLVAVVEIAAHVIGIAAGGHRKIRVFLDNDHFRVVVDAPGFGRGFGAGGRSADDDEFVSFCS